VRMVAQRERETSISLLDAHSDAAEGIVEALIATEASRTASLIMNVGPHIGEDVGQRLTFCEAGYANWLA